MRATSTDRPGGIFVRPADQMSDEDRILVQTVARVVLTDARGDLASQIDQRSQAERVLPTAAAAPRRARRIAPRPRRHRRGRAPI